MPVLAGAEAAARVQQWLVALPPAEAALAQAAIDQLVGLSPACDLRWAFGGPFVYAHGKIFAFVGRNRASGLHVGLALGAQLSDPHGLLTAADRALIRHYRLAAAADLDREAYLELLQQQLDIAQRAAAEGRSGWSGQLNKGRSRPRSRP